MANDNFLSVENMKLCQKVFESYMQDKYDFNISKDGSKTNVKKLLFDIMQDVNDKNKTDPSVTLKDKNNITLNIARDFFKSNYKLSKPSQKPNLKSLERDQSLYGPRVVNFEQIKPSPTFKKSVESIYESEAQSRKMEQQQQPELLPQMKPVLESAYDPDDFLRKLSELEKKRDDIEVKDLTFQTSDRLAQDANTITKMVNEPKDLYSITQKTNTKVEDELSKMKVATGNISGRGDFITPQINQMILIDKYMAINGFDRNWIIEKNRFSFKVDFNYGENSIQQRYRNIRSIEATRVIIPMEIQEIHSIINVPKTHYNYEFSFSYPYLMLFIDEFNDVYDGTNDNIRRCFCQLVFDKCYKSPNGRGYIILNPIQKERKVFHPTPLSSLSRMSLSLRKPNGELFNNSKDDYKVFKVEYELRNKQCLKIVTNIYFDRNEFYKGDIVMIRDFAITAATSDMNADAINSLNDYINRQEGHEIVEMGQANDRGYYRTYYINAPGAFDINIGEFVLNTNAISNLNMYNDTIDFSSWTGINGSILNTSLQCSATFKVQSVTTDPSIVDISYNLTNL